MSVADLMEAMAKAGAPMEAIILAVRALEAKDDALRAAEQEAADKRAAHAEWKRQNRAAKKEMDSPCDVHGLSMDSDGPPPVLDKETSPRPPKEINPSPRVISTLARKAGGFGPPNDVALPLWNEFCGQRKKPLTETAYVAILAKLAEAAEAGWPPGDLFTRALEGSWETIFVPKEPRNGRTNGMAGSGQPANRSSGVGLIDAIRESRANREAVPWDAGDTGGMQSFAGMG